MKKLGCLIVLLLVSFQASAQLYFRPIFGKVNVSQTDNDINFGFNTTRRFRTLTWGIFDYQYNEKLKFSLGLIGNTVDGYHVLDIPNNPGSFIYFGNLFYLFRGQALLNYKLADINLIKTRHSNPQGYLLRFRLEGILGITTNTNAFKGNILPTIVPGPLRFLTPSDGTDTFTWDRPYRFGQDELGEEGLDWRISFERRTNVGIQVGVGMQFQSLGKRNWTRLDFMFTQGLGFVHRARLDYQFDSGSSGSIAQASRGSAYWVQISQPIRLSKRKYYGIEKK